MYLIHARVILKQTEALSRMQTFQRNYFDVNLCDFEKFTHARYVVIGTHAFLEQSIANFPSEYRWTFAFVLRYLRHHFSCRYSGLRTTYRSGPDRTGFVIPAVKKV